MINDFRDALLGWLLGTLSPGVQRAILRVHRRAKAVKEFTSPGARSARDTAPLRGFDPQDAP
jgi:hypothetical protein